MMMKSIRRATLGAAGLTMALAWTLSADTLQMKNGRVLQGQYLGGTDRSVRFETRGRVEQVPIQDIISITFTDAPVTGSAAPPPEYAPPPPSYPPDQPPPDYPPQSADRRAQQQEWSADRQPQNYPPPPPDQQPPPQYDSAAYVNAQGAVVFPAGTHLLVRMIDGVDSKRDRVGDTFRATLDTDLLLGSRVVIPRGTDITGRLSAAQEAGQLTGHSQLKLELTAMVVRDRDMPIVTGEYEIAGKGRGTNTAEKVGGGAVLGAIIGGIAGGGRGAAVGAGVGAGAGATVNIVTRGEQVRVPSETLLDFRLEQPLVVAPGWGARN